MKILSDIAEVRMGYPFRDRLMHKPSGAVAAIQMKDIDDENLLQLEDTVRLDIPDLNQRHLVQAGDLVFRSRGKTYSAVLVPESIGPAVVAAPLFLVRPTKVLPAYLHWYINFHSTQTKLTSLARGTSVLMIGKSDLDSLEIPTPSAEQQQRIVEFAALAATGQRLEEQISKKRKRLADGVLMRYARNTR